MDATEAIQMWAPQPDSERSAALRPLVRSWVLKTLPCSANAAVQRMRVTTRFCLWCEDQGFAIDAETILVEDLIEAWFSSGDVTIAAKGTYRSHLRTVAKANTRKAIWTPTPGPMRRSSLRDPYTPQEVEGYFRLVPLQSTPRRRRILDVVLHLGLGTGLTPSEMYRVGRHDVTRQEGLVLVDVRTRVVPARQQYAAGVFRVAAETDGERLLGDHLGDHLRFERIINEVVVPGYLPPLRARRLRTTWLVSVLSDANLTLGEFRRVSGLRSGRVLDDLVPHLPIEEDTYLRRAAGR